jgi:hypothetical protein
MQQVVLRQRHQVLLLMHNPLHQQLQQQEQQPTCATATVSKSQAIPSNNCTFTMWWYFGTGLITLVQERIPLHKPMQQVVLRQRHQVLLLMHNPLHQQLQQQEQLRSQHVQLQQAVSRLQVIAHPMPILSHQV